MPREVGAINIETIARAITHWGIVRLAQTLSDDESLLAVMEWPKKGGKTYYACAVTGLLFDVETGDCRQSSRCQLLLDTLTPASPKDLRGYLAKRRERSRRNRNISI